MLCSIGYVKRHRHLHMNGLKHACNMMHKIDKITSCVARWLKGLVWSAIDYGGTAGQIHLVINNK